MVIARVGNLIARRVQVVSCQLYFGTRLLVTGYREIA